MQRGPGQPKEEEEEEEEEEESCGFLFLSLQLVKTLYWQLDLKETTAGLGILWQVGFLEEQPLR